MPRIRAATVAENREQRRAELLRAAAHLTLRSGTFTVAEVTAEVGLSRSAFYEYFTSTGDLVADVLLDELDRWSADMVAATAGVAGPDRIRAWVGAVLAYVADGRHALLRAAATVEIPEPRRVEVQQRHRALVEPLVAAVTAAGVPDPASAAVPVWGAVEAVIAQIESGATTAVAAEPELIAFVEGGLAAVARAGGAEAGSGSGPG